MKTDNDKALKTSETFDDVSENNIHTNMESMELKKETSDLWDDLLKTLDESIYTKGNKKTKEQTADIGTDIANVSEEEKEKTNAPNTLRTEGIKNIKELKMPDNNFSSRTAEKEREQREKIGLNELFDLVRNNTAETSAVKAEKKESAVIDKSERKKYKEPENNESENKDEDGDVKIYNAAGKIRANKSPSPPEKVAETNSVIKDEQEEDSAAFESEKKKNEKIDRLLSFIHEDYSDEDEENNKSEDENKYSAIVEELNPNNESVNKETIKKEPRNIHREKRGRTKEIEEESAVFNKFERNEEKIPRRASYSYEKIKNQLLYKVSEEEYTAKEQNDAIFKNYSKVYISEFIRLISCTLLFLAVLYLESAPVLGFKLPTVLDVRYYNFVYILVNLQIMLIAARFIVNKSLVYGLKSLIKNHINVYGMTFIVFAVTFLHTVLTYILKYNKQGIFLFNSLTLFLFCVLTVKNILRVYREILTFKVVCSPKNKYGIKTLKNNSHERLYFDDYITENTNVGVAQISAFVSNFFSRTNMEKENKTLKITVLSIISASVLLFAILFVIKGKSGETYGIISSAVAFILASMPVCACVTVIYPQFKIQKKLYEKGSAIIGESSIDHYSNTSVFSVYDKDLFPPELIKVANMSIPGKNHRIESVIQHLCCIFEKINSPLFHVFKASINFEPGFDKNVTVVDIQDNGICFISNGQKFFTGNAEYISNLGLVPIKDDSKDKNFDEIFLKSSGSILFFASEREIIAKFLLKYELTADFADIIKNLARLNICLGVRTLDPNISDELLKKLVANKKYCINVVKLKNFEERQKISDTIDVGIVSKTTLKSLTEALVSCNKIKYVIKSNVLVQIFASLIGAIISAAMIFTGGAESINVLSLLVFHIFWFIPVLFLSNLTPH